MEDVAVHDKWINKWLLDRWLLQWVFDEPKPIYQGCPGMRPWSCCRHFSFLKWQSEQGIYFIGWQKGIRPVRNGGWWRWALLSPVGVAPSRIVCVSVSVNLPLHHKVQKFSSGTSLPGCSRKKGRKTVVVWWWWSVKCGMCIRA